MSEKPESYLDLLSHSLAQPTPTTAPSVVVKDLLDADDIAFEVVAGHDGLDRPLATPKVQLLGLALAGFMDDLEPASAQILGRAELRFIQERLGDELPIFFQPGAYSDIGCFLTPEGLDIPAGFAARANELKVPVLRSKLSRLELENEVVRFLESALAPQTSFHGVLVVVCGLGILILGKSGIGKSDCALDLITHGHQLVADDVVCVRKNTLGQLIGFPKEPVRQHMDIRGLGIVNIKELFSVYSVMDEHAIDMVIFLEPWEDKKAYLTGNGEEKLNILGVDRPLYRLPVSYGRNWVNLIQVAVRKHILQLEGYDAEKSLSESFGALIHRK